MSYGGPPGGRRPSHRVSDLAQATSSGRSIRLALGECVRRACARTPPRTDHHWASANRHRGGHHGARNVGNLRMSETRRRDDAIPALGNRSKRLASRPGACDLLRRATVWGDLDHSSRLYLQSACAACGDGLPLAMRCGVAESVSTWAFLFSRPPMYAPYAWLSSLSVRPA